MTRFIVGKSGVTTGCRFIEENELSQQRKGSGGIFGEAIFFGADAVREGVAIPEEIRIAIPSDYGRDQRNRLVRIAGFPTGVDSLTMVRPASSL